MGAESPVVFVNVVTFLSMVWFWALSLLQGSCWLIDFYWTVIPVMIAAFYKLHPHSNAPWSFPAELPADPCGCMTAVVSNLVENLLDARHLRSNLALVLLGMWSARLTFSYLRRECAAGVLGHREDWRFSDMRNTLGAPTWALLSLFYAYLSQHVLLVGISLPFFVIHHDAALAAIPFGEGDVCVLAVALFGVLFAARADTELYEYMQQNEGRRILGMQPSTILHTGLWAYSRHPNYFGECVWWGALSVGYGLVVFLLAGADPATAPVWIIAGWAINTIVMILSIKMIETRMTTAPAGFPNGSPNSTATPKHISYRYYKEYTAFMVPFLNSKETYLCNINKRK
jgi:steroid 5-alpha reductase family enzyme